MGGIMRVALVFLGLMAVSTAKTTLSKDKQNSLKALEDMLNNLKNEEVKEAPVKKETDEQKKAREFLSKKFPEDKVDEIMKEMDDKMYGSGSGYDLGSGWGWLWAWIANYYGYSGSGGASGSGY